MLNFLKNYWLLIVLAVIATFLGIGKVYLSLKPPAQAPVYENTWNNITPGKSSLDDLASFGQPASTEQIDGSTVINYNSDVGDLKHKIYSQDDKVGLIKEQVWGKESLKNYTDKYGLAEGEFYGEHQESGYKLYAFPSQGLAIIAHPDAGYVLEKWYFQPMTLDGFLSSWGKDLSIEGETSF